MSSAEFLGADGLPMKRMATAYSAGDPVSAELAGWHPQLSTVDADWGPNRDRIVARIHDLARNDGWASGGVSKYLDNVIGSGLRLSAKPDYRVLNLSPEWASEFAAVMEGHFRTWANDIGRYNDAERHLTFGQQLGLALRHKMMDGDGMAIAHWLPDRGGAYATTLQIVSPDRCTNPHGEADSKHLRMGVKRDSFGAAEGYWFRNSHPGDTAAMDMDAFTWTYVPRETAWGRQVGLHHFDKTEAGQARGVSKLVPIVERLKMVNRYDKVELQASVLNAILAAVITSPMDHGFLEDMLSNGPNAEISNFQNERLAYHKETRLRMNDVRIPTLFPGEKIETIDSTRPNAAYADFEAQALRNISSAFGLSYEQLSNDWSKTNYSSARAAMLEVWKGISKEREGFAQGFATPVYALLVEEVLERGDIKLPAGAPDFWENKTAYCRAKWIGPPKGYVDPLKEADAGLRRMETEVSTLEDECAEQGKDWEEVQDQRAREMKRRIDLGLATPPSEPASLKYPPEQEAANV